MLSSYYLFMLDIVQIWRQKPTVKIKEVRLSLFYFSFHFYFIFDLFFHFLFLEPLGLELISHAVTIVT